METNKRILLCRKASGIGDWIMMADAIIQINIQHPDVDVYVLSDRDGRCLIPSICGCKCTITYMSDASRYDGVIDHVHYKATGLPHGTHIISDMIRNITNEIPWLELDTDSFRLSRCVVPSKFPVPDDYVIVPSWEPDYSKPLSSHKQYRRYDDLVSGLSDLGCNVYELNTWCQHDRTYGRSKGVLYTTSFSDTAKILKNARFSVLCENGLNHWACHNGGKTYTLFQSTKFYGPENIWYPTMTPIDARPKDPGKPVMPLDPDKIIEIIKENEKWK